jgi:hypothetical protein
MKWAAVFEGIAHLNAETMFQQWGVSEWLEYLAARRAYFQAQQPEPKQLKLVVGPEGYHIEPV